MNGNIVDEDASNELLVFDAEYEREGFELKYGIALEEWALQAFSAIRDKKE